ncbi:MAG: sulfatase [Spirochaetaceae bacterium]
MNIVYLHTHDSGTFLDPANGALPLPGVQRLASEGVTFRNAFSAAPTCSPSRSALLTGVMPHVNGMTGLAHRGFRIADYTRHLANVCAEAGMETVLCGVQHVAPHKKLIGYHTILDGETDYFARADIVPQEWDRENIGRVKSFLRGKRSRPFFLSFGLLSSHRPFPDPDEGVPERSLPAPPSPVPDTPRTRQDMQGFLSSLSIADEAVGVVTETLRETGRWEDTVVLLTTDHGPPFPGMKCTLSDGGIGVSLVLRAPGIAESGRVEHALVSQLDLYPTICDLLRIPWSSTLEGRSLLPVLSGENKSVRDAVFAEINYHANYEPARAVRTQRYKLVRRYGQARTPLRANVDDSASKAVMSEAGYFETPRPREQLVDLLLDPTERMDFSMDAAYTDVLRDLTVRLDRWMAETEDPLRTGHVPRPPGSRVNRQDARSAEEPTIR